MHKKNRTAAEVARCVLATLVLAAAPAAVIADEESQRLDPAADEDPAAKISGTVNMDFNTHFMSYGLNVWQKGTFEDFIWNPSAELSFELPYGISFYGGTWFDINNNADTSIGSYVQEVDAWVGFGYSYDIFSASITYQAWAYGGSVERILDIGLGLDVIGSPSLTIHNRVDGNGSQKLGTVFVLGASHTFDQLEFVSFTPFTDLGFVTEDYYVDGEGGFGYWDFGIGIGIPLSFVPSGYGEWSLNITPTYYYTDGDNIDNKNNSIFTGMAGISLAF